MQIKKTIISMHQVSMFININKKFENVSFFYKFYKCFNQVADYEMQKNKHTLKYFLTNN